MKIGIDFGTSFSLPAMSYLGSNIILLPGGKYGIPSVFYYDEWEGVLIGEEAERVAQGVEAANLKREIKLELNSSFTADGKTFTARQIVGYILNNVKQTALSVAKEKLISEPLEGVVISVPAAFTHNEKEFIIQAAKIPANEGGPELKVLGVIKEPVAAALAYYKASLEDMTRVLVYDLGGGTCDVAIVEANSSLKEKYKVIDSDMRRIGGKDWDAKLVEYITKEVEKQSGISLKDNPGYKDKIKREAISVKHAFSEKVGDKYKEKVRAGIEINGRLYRIPFTRKLFDELTVGLLDETIQLAKDVLARNDSSNISKIVCVGGCSNMPQVKEGLKRAFAGKDIQIYEPEKAIAIGASIYAEKCEEEELFVSDIASFSYGIRCFQDYNIDKYVVVNLIKRGDRLPKKATHYFQTPVDNPAGVSFKVIESMNIEKQYNYSEKQIPILELELKFTFKVPKGTMIKLYMTLTPDGIIEVTADDEKGHAIKVQKQLNI